MDDDGGSATETLEVTVGNVAPTLEVADDQAVDEGELLALASLGTFTDPGTGDTHTATIDWGDGSEVMDVTFDSFATSNLYSQYYYFTSPGEFTVTSRNYYDYGDAPCDPVPVTSTWTSPIVVPV